jgi:SAM-dependent methyltransferase
MDKENHISTYYDKYWDRENDATWTPKVSPWPDVRFQNAFGGLCNLNRVLDVGCGDGTTYQSQLRDVVRELWAIDASAGALKAVAARGVQTAICRIDSETFPLEDNYFDGASCIEVCEHLFDPLFAVREIYRVLKPGGQLVTSVPNFGYFADRLEALLRGRVRDCPFDRLNPWAGAHIRFFNLRSFKTLLMTAGFEIVNVVAEGDCSIFDALRPVAKLIPTCEWIKENIPGPLRLKFLETIAPTLFAPHILLVARKPTT